MAETCAKKKAGLYLLYWYKRTHADAEGACRGPEAEGTVAESCAKQVLVLFVLLKQVFVLLY